MRSIGTSIAPQIGKTYKVSFDVLEQGSGANSAYFGGVLFSTANLAVGSYVFYVTATSTGRFSIFGRDGSVFSITNISVKEVGMDWNFTSGATLTDIGAKITHTPTAGSIAQSSVLTIGNLYKLTYEITESISGGLKFNSAIDTSMVTTIGVHTKYFEADGTTAVIGRTSSSNNDITITNISVIEITDDTNLPRINYEGFSYQDALGSELITNGDFSDGSTDWTLNDWTIADGKASLLNGSSFIIQNNILEIGKTYKIQYTISDYVSGTIRWRSAGVNGSVNASNGVVTDYITVASTSFGIQGYNGFTGSIDNVSVKEYLGQEVVPDSGCGAWLFEPQSTNLVTYSEDLSTYTTTQTTVSTTTEKSPIKSVTPFLITEIAATNQHYIGGNSISLSGNNTLSCFVKNVSLGRYFKMWGLGLGAINEAVIFDTNTETIYEPPTTNCVCWRKCKVGRLWQWLV